jgi:hypothetical protein
MITNPVHRSQLLSVVAIVGILGLAYWLDMLTISWRRQARAEFNMQPFLFFYFLLPLIFAGLAIFLSWLLLVHFKATWVTHTLCLLIGINFVVIAASIVFPNALLSQIVNHPGFAVINRAVLVRGNESMMYQMEAVILVIGVINFIRTIQASIPKSQ